MVESERYTTLGGWVGETNKSVCYLIFLLIYQMQYNWTILLKLPDEAHGLLVGE